MKITRCTVTGLNSALLYLSARGRLQPVHLTGYLEGHILKKNPKQESSETKFLILRRS